MGIHATTGKLHWNYFLALERDLDVVSRYIEFCESNFGVYSIELAHLLFAAASEVDIVAKLLCERVAPTVPRANINDYKAALLPAIPDLTTADVFVSRYGLSLRPWSNWAGANNPDWWRSYNNVKHERDTYFHEATLKNALNALGALLVLTFHLYSRILAIPPEVLLAPKEATRQLNPPSTLMRLDESLYYSPLIV